jgi:hypothetical protein
MRKIGSYSGSVDDIVERQLGDEWAGLKKKGKWLLEVERLAIDSLYNGMDFSSKRIKYLTDTARGSSNDYGQLLVSIDSSYSYGN